MKQNNLLITTITIISFLLIFFVFKNINNTRKMVNDTQKIIEYQNIVNLALKNSKDEIKDIYSMNPDYKIEEGLNTLFLIRKDPLVDFYGIEINYQNDKIGSVFLYKP